MAELEWTDRPPGVEEYVQLRLDAGLSARSVEAARRGLPRSLHAVCVRRGGALVGMGRVVGDGGCNFEIVDVAVHPDHQRLGLGRQIMTALMNHVEQTAPPSAYLSLIADGGAGALYAQFGFEPVAPGSVGMARRM